MILGPRQIGKTTFLNLLSRELSSYNHTCVYIYLDGMPSNEEAFYEWLIEEIAAKLPEESLPGNMEQWKKLGPRLNFFNFLKALKPKENNEKIVFLLDETGRADYFKGFLRIWKRVYDERSMNPELNQFALVIAGAEDIVSLTMTGELPFNISRELRLNNFTAQEAIHLIKEPTAQLELKWVDEASRAVLTWTAGHPQQLQHLCHILVDDASSNNNIITLEQVNRAVEAQFINSYTLNTLDAQLKEDETLKQLLIRLIAGEEIKFLNFQQYSISHSGPIVRDTNSNCQFRSPLFKEYLSQKLAGEENVHSSIPSIQPVIPEPGQETADAFITTIYCHESPTPFAPDHYIEEEEIAFLKVLFRPRTQIVIQKNTVQKQPEGLSSNEKLLLCYLAYKNYKAFQTEAISTWEDIPNNYRFRVSSRWQHNTQQVPEWKIFREALTREGTEQIGDNIKAWVSSLRGKLAVIESRDLIHSTGGRGSGYLLRGTVRIEKI